MSKRSYFRRILRMNLLFILICCIVFIKADAVKAEGKIRVNRTYPSVYLDDGQIYIQGYTIGDNNYFKLRDLAKEFKDTANEFNVEWNNEKKLIEIIEGKPYLQEGENANYYSFTEDAYQDNAKILLNNKIINLNSYIINGNNYFKLRDLGELLSFDVKWMQESGYIQILSKPPEGATRVSTNINLVTNIPQKTFHKYGWIAYSYIIDNSDGTMTVVDSRDGIYVEKYDRNYNLLERKEIHQELPIFGGFYHGKKYNYFVFGQKNREERYNKEVIRVVKYDKSFQRLDSLSISGGESFTIEPFVAGSAKMDENNGMLTLHTSRERFKTSDGLNHQSQLTVEIETDRMRVKNYLGEFQGNHVGHSFDQYVRYDEDRLFLIDHGDAYPRSIVLNEKIIDEGYTSTNLLNIPGEIGENFTGVSLGGFEISSTSYLISASSVDFDRDYRNENLHLIGGIGERRDVCILTAPRINRYSYDLRNIKIANYMDTNIMITTPRLVKINDEKFMVLWQEIHADKPEAYMYEFGDVKYIYLDENGNPASDIQGLKGFQLSNCDPIIWENKVIWYTNDRFNNRLFYTIPIK